MSVYFCSHMQHAVAAYAEALEVVPRILAENAGQVRRANVGCT